MPPYDDGHRDRFPDMSIPDNFTRPESTPAPIDSTAPADWKEGDRVLAPWEPEFLYAGHIGEIQVDQAMIQFEDGDAGWVFLEQLRPLAVPRGQKVLSRKKMGQGFHPGEVAEVRGDDVCIHFADGDHLWTKVAALRIPCPVRGPGAAPTKMASHLAFFENLQTGDRVWAPLQGTALFAGRIAQLEGNKVDIVFDDGDRAWVAREELSPFEQLIGLPVCVRRDRRGDYLPGIITQVEGERICVEFENGNREWTESKALAIPLAPLGPDVQLPGAGDGFGSQAGADFGADGRRSISVKKTDSNVGCFGAILLCIGAVYLCCRLFIGGW